MWQRSRQAVTIDRQRSVILYNFILTGSETTKKVRPSAQGGVVSDPVYWNKGVVWMASMSCVKSRAPVLVAVPGVSISPRFSITADKSSVVLPSSVSWKGTAMTAIEPSKSVYALINGLFE